MSPLLVVASALAAGSYLPHETTLLERSTSLLGVGLLLGVGWLLSTDRRRIRWRTVAWGVGLQLLFALVVLTPTLQALFFQVVDSGVRRLLSFAEHGADFVFQSVEPHEILVGGKPRTFIGHISPPVKTFAFWVLPTIVFFSSLMSVLYHLGIMQPIVRALARIMQRTMGTSAAESLSAASNIFVGQTEAPLVVKPYVADMTRSELHAVMTGGFATVAGGVMAAYVSFLREVPGIAGHLVTASILSAPAALAVSKVMLPETEHPRTMDAGSAAVERSAGNVMEAAAQGATQGMTLALNVAAMLIAFVALVAMVDHAFSLLPVRFCDTGVRLGWTGACEPLDLSRLLGWLFSPFALAMGIPWAEAGTVGRLLGEKLVLTELLAYMHLGELVSGPVPVLSERSAIIASYALCGFANFASIGIQIGGIGGLAPNRVRDLSALGLRAMVAGTLAAFMTASVAGVLLG